MKFFVRRRSLSLNGESSQIFVVPGPGKICSGANRMHARQRRQMAQQPLVKTCNAIGGLVICTG